MYFLRVRLDHLLTSSKESLLDIWTGLIRMGVMNAEGMRAPSFLPSSQADVDP